MAHFSPLSCFFAAITQSVVRYFFLFFVMTVLLCTFSSTAGARACMSIVDQPFSFFVFSVAVSWLICLRSENGLSPSTPHRTSSRFFPQKGCDVRFIVCGTYACGGVLHYSSGHDESKARCCSCPRVLIDLGRWCRPVLFRVTLMRWIV